MIDYDFIFSIIPLIPSLSFSLQKHCFFFP